MLRQAVGLAKYMGRGHVVDGLKAVLDGDLAAPQEISDDSMTRYEQGLVWVSCSWYFFFLGKCQLMGMLWTYANSVTISGPDCTYTVH